MAVLNGTAVVFVGVLTAGRNDFTELLHKTLNCKDVKYGMKYRRDVLSGIVAFSIGLSGCSASGDVDDLLVRNRTGEMASVSLSATVLGESEETLEWSFDLEPDDVWTWNELGDRNLTQVAISTSNHPLSEESWGETGHDGSGVIIYIEEEEIDIGVAVE